MSKPPSDKPHLRQLAYLEYLLDFDLALLQHINDWQEGFPVATGGGPIGKGGHGDRVMSEATLGFDDSQPPPRAGHGLADQAIDLHRQILEAVAHLRDLANTCRRSGLKPLSPGAADLKARATDPRSTGVGYCAVDKCDHLCSGGLNDKLVKGFCPKCYRAWMRNLESAEPLTRQQFIDTRAPRNVNMTTDDGETPGASPDADNGVPSASSGREVSPASGPYCEHVPPNYSDPDTFRCTICRGA